MELLTQNLPSGYNYPFMSIRIKPMTFGQILEYLENCPDEKKSPVEKYYFDYCLVKDDDMNINNLFLIDMEYVIYFKKALTIAEDLSYDSSTTCPKCGAPLNYHVSLAGIQWNHMQPELYEGITITFGGSTHKVRMPKVSEFFDIFKKYRVYKKITDMKIIKLIALFEESSVYPQRIENLVVDATYKDISILYMLESLFYNFVEPIKLVCNSCADNYVLSEYEIRELKKVYNIDPEKELPDSIVQEVKQIYGGTEIGVDTLVSGFFRDLLRNQSASPDEVILREVREDA